MGWKRILATVALVVLAIAGALYGWAWYQTGRHFVAPATGIRGASSTEALARGERLFRAACADCHSPDGDTRPIGRFIHDVPAFLGRFYSTNLTSHKAAGVGSWSDGDLARVIRFGVSPDGRRLVVMPQFNQLGDDDIAALIGFLRSGHRDFAPDPSQPPRSRPSALGKLILVFAVGMEPRPASSAAPPAPGPTVEYGRYVADAVYQCWYCH